MALIFNELSTRPPAINKEVANLLVESLIKTFKEAKKFGYQKLRFFKNLQEIVIAEDYNLLNWLNETGQRNLKDILLEARDYPEYDENDLWFGEKYILSAFIFEDTASSYPKTKAYGLASAYLYHTLSLSLASSDVWKKNDLLLSEKNEENKEEKNVSVKNLFSEGCLNDPVIKKYIENSRPLTLEECELQPNDKKVHLSAHHGKNVLAKFSKRMVKNKFIVEIKSTDWGGNDFIRKIHEDGTIELVLYWTSRQYALLVQTKGRNLRETEEIGNILKSEFDN